MWLGLAALVCAVTGVVAGIEPKLGVLIPIGIAFSAVVLWNVTLGLCLFTVLAWLNEISRGGAAISGAKVAGLLVFLSWYAAKSLRPDPNVRALSDEQPGLVVAAVALGTWSALSMVWAHSRGTTLTETYTLVLEMLLFPIVFYAIRRREQLVWIVGAFVLGAFISALIGLGQHGSRQTGAVGDADSEGILLAASLILLIGFLASLQPGSWLKRWGWIGVLIVLAGLVNAGSRSGLVALACGLAAGVFFGGRWRSKAIAALLVAAGATGLYVAALAPHAATAHLTGSSSTGRTDLWRIGLRMFEANPIIGVGAGNFSAASVDYVQKVDNVTSAQYVVAQKPKPAHNTYLEFLDDLGIPGLVAFLTIVVLSISAALKSARIYERMRDTRAEVLSRCLAVAIVAELSGAFFISADGQKLLWLLLALPLPLLAIAKAEARLPQRG
jgi:O-antigen ligase